MTKKQKELLEGFLQEHEIPYEQCEYYARERISELTRNSIMERIKENQKRYVGKCYVTAELSLEPDIKTYLKVVSHHASGPNYVTVLRFDDKKEIRSYLATDEAMHVISYLHEFDNYGIYSDEINTDVLDDAEEISPEEFREVLTKYIGFLCDAEWKPTS